jgi:hypothetical protein
VSFSENSQQEEKGREQTGIHQDDKRQAKWRPLTPADPPSYSLLSTRKKG